MIYQLAESLGEYDPRKIANLPAQVLLHWQAHFNLQVIPPLQPDSLVVLPPETAVPASVAAQCADVMRVLNG
ncbi:hypothetical protein AXW38_09880 [Yersinia ruckeri]|nr:hypothetical protein AXW20_09865 [Yersinia ruckeri]OIX35904.1 hypothetical protein AXW19_09840 [Yersinia ruckeri]OIX36041.1 hypothetical protein AXW18_09860 [Yersinia ruckeri]OIX46274.1 hypothetical protein AXW21_09880 [Yersinia ruckeri]OIX46650.1 hypothetical protein AXW23_09850 [Yersinia ruckeri]